MKSIISMASEYLIDSMNYPQDLAFEKDYSTSADINDVYH